MFRKSLYFLPIILFLTILLLLFVGLSKDPNVLPSMLIGKPVPSFVFPSLDRTDSQISVSDFQNKITLLTVWASWCRACQIELPVLQDIARTQQITIIGLNYKDDRDTALLFLKQWGNPFANNIYDPQGKLGIELGVYGMPETFLIDQHGIIRFKYNGVLTRATWENILLPQIKKFR